MTVKIVKDRHGCVGQTMMDMVDEGLFEVTGHDEDGEPEFSLTLEGMIKALEVRR